MINRSRPNRRNRKRLKRIENNDVPKKHPVARPFLVDMGWAVGVLCAWLALCGFEPLIAAVADKLRLVVTIGAFRPQWPLGPTAVGVAGLVLAWLRYRFLAGEPQLQERLRRATLLAAALLALRLVALCDPLTYLFPFLTLLWSPHALWAVALVFLGYVHLPPSSRLKPIRTWYIAGGLLAVCLPLYLLYALYFCQITMLHGDEGQYLRVTQSLIRDGDMDLANNLSAGQVREFHDLSKFTLKKAPASPEGKIHSVHPIGLSVALVPAYWWGLTYWENPRLAAALFMAVLASLCVPLLFLYLTRLGAQCWAAWLATGIMAVTAPFFYYTNQLYPEIPALLITLIALLALVHWQVPGGSYRSLGRWEVPLLGLLTLLLCSLPFLHPRLVPLGILCGVGILLQAYHSQRRYLALSIVGLGVASGLCALIAFHYAFSGDWVGPLRPGSGAWGEGTLNMGIWSVSLPGHWLDVGKGLLNSAPIYFFALFGLLVLARLRDRRMAIALGLYGLTAAINGLLHSNWNLGFGFPNRALITALPVLVLGLAWSLPLLLRSATITFFAALALTISLESVLKTLVLTELGYEGDNLLGRSINHFYPLHQHFFAPSHQDLPLLDIAFWGLLVAALFFRPRHQGLRWAVIAAVAFAPFLWSKSDALAARLSSSLSPYMASRFLKIAPLEFAVPLRPSAEATQPNGSLLARPGATPARLVHSSLMGFPPLGPLHPGIYRLTFPGLRVRSPAGQVAGHLSISQHYTIQAVSAWGSRSSYPLIGGVVGDSYSLTFDFNRPSIGYITIDYSGQGELALDAIRGTFTPTPIEPQIAEIHRFAPESTERPIQAAVLFSNVPAGHYRVRYNLTGSTFARFFEREPVPLRTAVYAGPVSNRSADIEFWFKRGPYDWSNVNSPNALRPLQEGVHPPWWLSIPFAADQACQLRFVLSQPQEVCALLHYAGPSDLKLTDIVLYRETFDHRYE